MTTLDDVERAFDSDAVLVCDRYKPSGIAGIMGGQVCEVSEKTTRVLLEVATWDGVNILRNSRRLGLRSEASARFEKQLHPALTLRAQRVASALMAEFCGAKLVPGTIDEGGVSPSPRSSRSGRRGSRSSSASASTSTPASSASSASGSQSEVEGEQIHATVPPSATRT